MHIGAVGFSLFWQCSLARLIYASRNTRSKEDHSVILAIFPVVSSCLSSNASSSSLVFHGHKLKSFRRSIFNEKIHQMAPVTAYSVLLQKHYCQKERNSAWRLLLASLGNSVIRYVRFNQFIVNTTCITSPFCVQDIWGWLSSRPDRRCCIACPSSCMLLYYL